MSQHFIKVLMVLFTSQIVISLLLLNTLVYAENDYSTAAEMELMQGFPPPVDKRVDGSALLKGPKNRWAYQNMRMLYPSANVPHAERAIPLKKSIDGAIERLKIQKPGAGLVDVETWLEETYTDSVIIIHKDRVVYERFLNGMHSHQEHQMMSVTKSFAGLFGLLAVNDGLVSEGDAISTIIPELPEAGAFGDATFGQVLDMTNSMDFTEEYADPESGIVHYATVLGLMPPVPGRTYAKNMYEYLPSLKKDSLHAHGEVFHYQTPKTDVVNWVTNRVTKKSFQAQLYDKLWSKLGTDGETYVLLDKNVTLFAGGGLNATPYDLARFGMMMINDGKSPIGEQVVPASVIQDLADGADRKAFQMGPNGAKGKNGDDGLMADGNWSYRAQWWVRHTPNKAAFMALGVHGQWIYLDIERDVAIIKQSSQPVSSDDWYDGYNFNAWDAIISHLNK